uniref:Vacuolar protein sorting-associated protein 35 n=1 Tax=Globodera rostochiensis TaxID=31243 RepID=A0A914H1W4_GLORO
MHILTGTEQSFDSEGQEALLDAALKVVKNESFEMKRALDRNELMEGLKHAAQMLCELRTSLLTPKFYYRLYIDVTNELQHFLIYLNDRYLGEERKYSVAELYETVQYTGNIIPRLYLLITVGITYIKSGESSTRDILSDLVEMCRGVQHPLRGLFLRNYLLTSTKELLPDLPSTSAEKSVRLSDVLVNEDEQSLSTNKHGTVRDTIEFIMTNFAEMNKLWVRMQFQGPSREREKREKERRELRILVGTNLVRLSQLQNLDLNFYRKVVLPGILEQSVSCKEPISQEYLMECVIQVFPDHFHLSTLNEFLDACTELHSDVKVKNVLGTLIEHLALYSTAEDSPGIPADMNLFEIFLAQADKMIETRTQMAAEEVVSIQIALLNLALNCYRNRAEFADLVFSSTAKALEKLNIVSVAINSVIGREVAKLLRLPIEQYNNVVTLLQLDSFGEVILVLDRRGQRQIASLLIQNAIENETRIATEEGVEKFFHLIDSLLADPLEGQTQRTALIGGPNIRLGGSEDGDGLNGTFGEAEDQEDFEDEQSLVAKFVHLIHNDDLDMQFKLLNKVRKAFGLGGKARLRFTLPSVIFATHKFALRFAENRESENFNARMSKIFTFCLNTINALRQQAEKPELALRFYLNSSLVSDKIYYERSSEITYEFISKAFLLYEEEISESREQVQSLTLLIATITQIERLNDESHEPLRNQCALYASKLLKRPDQAQMLCLVARAFWHSKLSDRDGQQRCDGARVVECLRKATKIAAQCMEELVQCALHIHILSTQMHFFEQQCPEISRESIEQMATKLRENLLQMDPQSEVDQLNGNLTRIVKWFETICGQRERENGVD